MSDEEPCAAQPSRHGRGCRRRSNMELVEGRAARPKRRANEVIAPHELDFPVARNNTLEGQTDKQKNPHQDATLAWFVVRLGGLERLQALRPVGPKTIHTDGINSKP